MYAVSYDPQSFLNKFSEKFGITYPLLSDEGSATIRAFGIENTLTQTDASDEDKAKFRGIPFPGTYVVDESGVVIEKYFQRHYATRTSAGTVVNSALAKVVSPIDAPRAESEENGVSIDVFLADSKLYLEYTSTLCVRVTLDKGLHIYGEPIPEGYVATTATVQESKGIRVGQPHYPKTTPTRFDALNETLNVYEGVVDITFPITIDKDLLNWNKLKDRPPTVELLVDVQYQACSETTCFPPLTRTLSLQVPLAVHLFKHPKDPV